MNARLLHADETTGRAGATLSYVHVACTEYLTVLHVGDRCAQSIDAGQVLPAFTGVLVGDGYAGYQHLPALHAWCAAHLLRDLRSISDADPDGQLWALAMMPTTPPTPPASTVPPPWNPALWPRSATATSAHSPTATMKTVTAIPNCIAAPAHSSPRFRRFEDMILRFATDLTVPFTNNTAERAVRPVKIQQRTSGGAWRTLQGLADFAVVLSYIDTAHKWGIDKLDALTQLFTTGPWLPPALTPADSYTRSASRAAVVVSSFSTK